MRLAIGLGGQAGLPLEQPMEVEPAELRLPGQRLEVGHLFGCRDGAAGAGDDRRGASRVGLALRAAAQAGPEARRTGCGRISMEGDVLASRRARRAGGTAEHAGRRDRVDEVPSAALSRAASAAQRAASVGEGRG